MSAAQEAYARRDWRVARDLFRAGPAAAAADLSAWADAAWWLGLVDESIEVGERAYAANVAADRPAAAAVDALTVAANYLLRGEESAGSGWLARAARALAEAPDAPEHAYFRYLTEVENGPEDGRVDAARAVRAAGERFGDPNLIALGTLGEGRALLKAGRVADGLAALDEAMVAVRSADLRPDWVGMILCGLIAAAYEMADLRRAAEWVAATERWLTTLSEAVVFQGVCRVHRSQLRAVHGDWATAEREARQVCADVADIHLATAAEAHYTLGEIHRQRGALADAEEEYQRAHRLGRDPQPGVALLLLARRQPDAALASVRAALTAEAADRLARARLCAAQVEIALAAGDPATGRKAADELEETATAYDSPGLRAAAGSARGAVLLAEGHPAEALAVLRPPAGPGTSWTCPTRSRARSSCWPPPTGRWATPTAGGVSRMRRARCSGGSA